jgi:glycosyltransferase involved in cell wall biosynthesis
MRILHFTRDFPPLVRGGVSVAVGHLVHELDRLGYDQRVLSFDGYRPTGGGRGHVEWEPLGDDEETQARVLRIKSGPAYDDERPVIQKLNPQVVHVHDPLLWPVAWRTFGENGCYVYTLHMVHARVNEIRKLAEPTMSSTAEEIAVSAADMVLAPSTAAMEWAKNAYPACAPVSVVPLGIPLRQEVPPAADGIYADWWYIGRHGDVKGTDRLLNLAQQLKKRAPMLQGAVVSENPESPRRDARWRRREGEELRELGNVTLLGWQEHSELWGQIGLGSIVVVPSRCETFSMVALEAMRAGAVVVSTRCGGPEDLIEDGVTGVLCKDIRAVVGALIRLCSDREQRLEMGRAAKRRALQFSSLACAVRHAEIYALLAVDDGEAGGPVQ